jgi:23S rRNA pseudouridine1911/1915/1917 synthase
VQLLEGHGAPSRAEIQRWIAEGRVLVDGRTATRSTSVGPGVALVVRPAPPPLTHAVADPGVELVVAYEDEHLLVIDKPAGLVVHPARGHATGTLVNGLLARGDFELGQDDADAEAHTRPGIVHRIDKGTSGLLVVAKTVVVREALKALFAAHDIEREYVAIVVGSADDRTVSTLHGRHPTDRLRFSSRVTRGKTATTHVRVLERLRGATLVACRLETGRTHQIRVHLSEQLRTPILGDPLYGSRPRDPELARLADELGHQALHARLLGFVHPVTRARLTFESELPPDVKRVLEALRRR